MSNEKNVAAAFEYASVDAALNTDINDTPISRERHLPRVYCIERDEHYFDFELCEIEMIEIGDSHIV